MVTTSTTEHWWPMGRGYHWVVVKDAQGSVIKGYRTDAPKPDTTPTNNTIESLRNRILVLERQLRATRVMHSHDFDLMIQKKRWKNV